MNQELERDFGTAVRDGFELLARQYGYRATRFLQLVGELGAVQAARKFASDPQVHDGLARLWELKRLDLSVEAMVCDPGWSVLFTDDEEANARAKLNGLGYRVQAG